MGKKAKGSKTTRASASTGERDDDVRFPVERDPRFARIPAAAKLAPADDRFGLDERFAEPGVDARGKQKRDARGDGFDWDASSSDEEFEQAREDEEEELHVWEEGIEVGDASARLAVMGVNWDQCDAKDLFVLVQTFLESERATGAATGKGAKVIAAKVYMSELGRQKLAEEEASGPAIPQSNDQEAEEARLRAYAKQRLQYYFGVLELDTVETANFVYEQLDGLHVDLMTPRNLEVQYIPADMVLPGEPASLCIEAPVEYEPPVVASTTLSHSKGGLAYDQPLGRQQRDRVKVMTKRYSEKELAEKDLKDYLASSDEEDLDEENLAEYRQQLLGDAANDESGGSDVESAFGSDEVSDSGSAIADNIFAGVSENDKCFDITYDPKVDAAAAAIQQKAKQGRRAGTLTKDGFDRTQPKNSWETYLEKKKEKKKARKAEIKAQRVAQAPAQEHAPKKKQKWKLDQLDEDVEAEAALLVAAEDDRHFNLKGKGRKREADHGVDVTDERIARIFDDSAFAIDPTHPEYKKTKGMSALLEEKVARKRAKKPKQMQPPEPVARQTVAKKQVDPGFSLFA